MHTITHWIDNASHAGDSGRVGVVYDPATGIEQAQVALAGQAEVDTAVASAVAAVANWAELSLGRRQRVMFRFRELVERRASDVAARITAEHGKTLPDAMGEVERGLEVVEYACAVPQLVKGAFSENVSSSMDTYTLRQPLGVVAGITPFNFPAMVPMWMFPMAIACGNAFVLKPSDRDPSASLLLAELAAEAGLPAGILNVVQGDKTAVDALLAHDDVAAVSFVGSTPVARHIYATASAAGKRVQALGGAKNHMVVLPDADLEHAADALTSAAYGSAGERCMAVSVVVAVGGVGDQLVELLRERTAKLRVGPGQDPDSEMGPLITAAHRERVAGYVDAGSAEGAELVVDGRDVDVDGDGFFLGPCMFDHVRPDMSVYTDEIFGPVLVQLRTETLDEAIELVNASPYGNGVAIFTADGAAARAFQHRVQVGMIGINVPIPVPVAYHSFGGWKQSLFGDLHVYGEDAVRFYTRQKVITSRWPKTAAGINMSFPGSS